MNKRRELEYLQRRRPFLIAHPQVTRNRRLIGVQIGLPLRGSRPTKTQEQPGDLEFMNLFELAQRLKQLRVDRGLTLEDVASQAELTRGWLSKVENFRVTPSLPALSKICLVMGVSLSELFKGLDRRPPLVVVPKANRRPVHRDDDLSMLTYEALASDRPSRGMDPFVITVPKTDQRPQLAHPGEEFMYVIQGTVQLEYGDEAHRLGKGDCAYFDGSTPHRFVCVSKSPAEVLVVYHGVAGEDAADVVNHSK